MVKNGDLKERTKQFALQIMKIIKSLPYSSEGKILGTQLLRSATSVGANYRAACRGRSRQEFIAKMGIVEEEADEAAYWPELILEAGLHPVGELRSALQEANEIVAIMAASRKTASRALGVK